MFQNMLQRPKDYCAAGLLVAMFLIVFIPIWSGDDLILYGWFLRPRGEYGVYWPYASVGTLVSIVTLSIVIYLKPDSKHIRLPVSIMNTVLIGAIIGLLTYFTKQLNEESMGSYGPGFFAPMLAIFLNLLYIYLMLRDEKLLQDSERVR